jgi:hypothetical protein
MPQRRPNLPYPQWPAPLRHQITGPVDDELFAAILERVARDGVTRAELLRRALRDYLTHNGDDAEGPTSASSELQPARVPSG